jgi:DNA modification methylase
LTADETDRLRKISDVEGHGNVSELVRHWISENTPMIPKGRRSVPLNGVDEPSVFWKNRKGKMYSGDSLGLLHSTLKPASIDLIVTSPPFGLIRKKAYGNAPSSQYLNWFRPFAEGMHRVLKKNGSLVIDIGPAWTPGLPTKSLYQFDLLSMLCREFGFHLAQDFYWWNPSRMPAPAEWVNVRRLRAKDAINPVWWLSPTPWPKASNKRVLTHYGESQKSLFRNGYNSGKRPSGHVVSKNWGLDNGGAIPPNFIAAPNTVSDDPYQEFCRAKGIQAHPARFPWALPEFFIRMLTDKNDVVLDPFAGSCLTGAVAQTLNRKWICGEIRPEYLTGAMGRFQKGVEYEPPSTPANGYRVPTMKEFDGQATDTLLKNGGKKTKSVGSAGPPTRVRKGL